METILGGLAFACLIAAQFFAVVVIHTMRWESGPTSISRDCTKHLEIWKLTSSCTTPTGAGVPHAF
jgi:hypothetical protein